MSAPEAATPSPTSAGTTTCTACSTTSQDASRSYAPACTPSAAAAARTSRSPLSSLSAVRKGSPLGQHRLEPPTSSTYNRVESAPPQSPRHVNHLEVNISPTGQRPRVPRDSFAAKAGHISPLADVRACLRRSCSANGVCKPASPRPAAPAPSFSGKFFVPRTPDMAAASRKWSPQSRRRSLSKGLPFRSTNPHRPTRLRLVRRDVAFHQSSGRIYMHRSGHALDYIARKDLFHVALSMPAAYLFVICVSTYTFVILCFAALYMLADHPGVNCAIAPAGEWPTFYHAFAFSLETLTTIGYGLPYAAGPTRLGRRRPTLGR